MFGSQIVLYYIATALIKGRTGLTFYRMRYRLTIFKVIAALVAVNYAMFRLEVFDRENEQDHPSFTCTASITSSSINWETFDKDNAPQAFVIQPEFRILLIEFVSDHPAVPLPIVRPFEHIRDKSPPSSLVNL